MTNYNLPHTQSIKTKHTTLSRNLTKLTFNYICCSRMCVDMGSTATYGCPLSTQTSTGSTAYPCVAQAPLRTLTLARAKTFPCCSPLNIHSLYPCRDKDHWTMPNQARQTYFHLFLACWQQDIQDMLSFTAKATRMHTTTGPRWTWNLLH